MNNIVDGIIERDKDKLIASLQESIRIPSTEGAPEPGAPFGKPVAEALEHALATAEGLGLSTVNMEGYAGCIELGDGPEMLGVICHMDVVPEGTGWAHPAYGADLEDGILYGYSSLIMLVIAVVYKAVLVLMGLFFFIFYHGFVVHHVGDYIWLVYLGFVLNIAYIALLLVVCLKPLWSRKMGIKAINLLVRLHIFSPKKSEKMIARLTRIFDNYVKASKYIRDNMGSLFTITLITVFQRLALFMLTWIVYKAYGLAGTSFMQIVALQVIIGVAVEMLPLPGAAGITEACFVKFFEGVFTIELISPSILLNRGLSFYAVIVIGGLVTLFTHLLNIKKYGKDTDKEKQKQELEQAAVVEILKSDEKDK